MGTIHVIGGGLAGSEAAWQCLQAGNIVKLYEMRPTQSTPAHQSGRLAELVCSNSLKALDENSASGLLKKEMEKLDSLILSAAFQAKVPAGGALAVDREQFSSYIEKKLGSHPSFERVDRCISSLDDFPKDDMIIVATGPLTTDELAIHLNERAGGSENLFFYDAIAPVLSAESINYDECYFANRYDKGTEDGGEGDYLNLPLNKEEYEEFVDDVLAAEKTPLHEFEKTPYFECCLPIEVMIERGRETLRFGPLKPVGLIDPRTDLRPWAVIQLRQENLQKSMYSMVGFQTKMKWGEQKRIFGKLPGLKEAEFLRFGSVHRNTYFQSPEIIDGDLSLKKLPNVFLAGQITGVEGYLESSAMGLLAGRFASAKIEQKTWGKPPVHSMIGALLHYVTEGPLGKFQPMNTNMGLLPMPPKPDGVKKIPKKERRQMMCEKAREEFAQYLSDSPLS